MEECLICFGINENNKTILKCNHVYHEECIEHGFDQSSMSIM